MSKPIINFKEKRLEKFINLLEGEMFVHPQSNILYLKTDTFTVEDMYYNCVAIEDGMFDYFEDNYEVHPTKKVTIDVEY
jgi:hypothetical protein